MKNSNDIRDFVSAHVRAISRELKHVNAECKHQEANQKTANPQGNTCHQNAMLEAYQNVLNFIEDKKEKRYFY
ncbi:MAG: hypothetical protein JEZ03_02090 [Bacteroidales bacterium]|nr:hypothetical protein [Bacteroidales bacterium]